MVSTGTSPILLLGTGVSVTVASVCLLFFAAGTGVVDIDRLHSIITTKNEENGKMDAENNEQNGRFSSFRIEIDFFDKLRQKSYVADPNEIPNTLRILTVDLPDLRHRGFRHGDCRLATHKVYPDGVAPPAQSSRISSILTTQSASLGNHTKKSSSSSDAHHNESYTIEIEQKAWVQSLVECFQKDGDRIGVEIMEASVNQLNPRNLHRDHPVTTLGSYLTSRKEGTAVTENSQRRHVSIPRQHPQTSLEDELDAPWNQHAWKSEMDRRISGQVKFAENLEPSKRSFGRMFMQPSNHYQATVFHGRHLFRWFLFRDNPNTSTDREKPHAVIADGAALHKIPNAFRLLQQTCREHHVPLYVIRDPRVWGSNTHSSLGEALRHLRQTLKAKIIREQMEMAAGTSFRRGRMVGKMEEHAKWQAREVVRRAEHILEQAEEAKQRRKDMDWKHWDRGTLEQELMRRGVIEKKHEGNATVFQYSQALQDMLRAQTTGHLDKKGVHENDKVRIDRDDEEETPAE
jgi:hypothetical protein